MTIVVALGEATTIREGEREGEREKVREGEEETREDDDGSGGGRMAASIRSMWWCGGRMMIEEGFNLINGMLDRGGRMTTDGDLDQGGSGMLDSVGQREGDHAFWGKILP